MNRGRILIVEDRADLRKLIRFTLNGQGFDVQEAETGEEALQLLQTARPALVLLDVMLPGGLDGLEICRAIKSDARTRDTQVVLLSARTQEADLEAGREAGADDYIKKPFSPGRLLERVEKWMA